MNTLTQERGALRQTRGGEIDGWVRVDCLDCSSQVLRPSLYYTCRHCGGARTYWVPRKSTRREVQ
jgi:hypothetical protein